jgi:ribonucleotide monophosphatase NagD (HAD superfamily)
MFSSQLQDVRDDVLGAMNAGLMAILVQTGELFTISSSE